MNTDTLNLVETGTLWLPERVNALVAGVDHIFYFLLWSSFIVSAIIIAITIHFLFRYRRTAKTPIGPKHITHNNALEATWTIIPIILVIFIFFWGVNGYIRMMIPPDNAMEIRVTGKKWLWEFKYPQTGITAIGELVVPVNTPIRLVMDSTDVIHSFFLPNFRVKRDVIPNRYTRIWFQADKPGNYQIFCTEYCGDGHSAMLATLRVLSPEDYAKWQTEGSGGDDLPLAELGARLYTSKACNTCHSTDGSIKVGPSWQGLFGSQRQLQSGQSVTADENYIRESMVNPGAKVVQGFQNVMPTYAGSLTDNEINALIEYIKSL